MTSRSHQNAHEFANIILKCFSSTKNSYIWNAFWLKDISTCIVAEHCEVVYLTLIRYFNPCFTKIRTLGAVPIYRRHLTSIVIPLIKVRLSHDRFIFIMEIPCLKRPSLCWVGALVVRCEAITGTNFSNVIQWIWRNQIFFSNNQCHAEQARVLYAISPQPRSNSFSAARPVFTDILFVSC